MRVDVKGEVILGIVLLATALLVGGGGLNNLIQALANDVLDRTADPMGFARTLGSLLGILGLASLPVSVAAAIIVDRQGPRWVMPLGALSAGVGFILLALTDSLGWLRLTSLVTSLGLAGVVPVCLYAVAVKGCYRFRGTVIGILVFVTSLGPTVASPLFVDSLGARATALVSGGLALVGAVFLFRVLPRVFPVLQHPDTLPLWRPTPEDERDLTGRGLMQLPGFWKVAGMLTLVSALGTALSVSSSIHLGMAHAASEGIPNLLPHATAFGALFWGAASDFFRVRFLITAASLMAAVALGLFWLLTEQPGMVGVVAVGLALGATHSLVWVLLADHVGVRFFATVAVAVSFVGSFLGSLSVPLVLNSVGFEAGVPVMAALALTLAIAAFIAPRLSLTVLDQEAI